MHMKDRIRRLIDGRNDGNLEPETEAERPCPHCGKPVSRGATVCLHCEMEVQPLMSYSEFALKFGSPHSGGPPHGVKGRPEVDRQERAE